MGLIITPGQDTALGVAGLSNNPMVVMENVAENGVLSSIRGVLPDGALANAIDGATTDYWSPDMAGLTTADFDVELSQPVETDFVGIVGHNFGTLGVGVRAQYSTNGGANWTSLTGSDVVPADNEAFGIWYEPQTRNRLRLLLSNVPAGAQPFAAVVLFGRSMSLEQRVYAAYQPRIVPTEVEQVSNITEGNHLAGTKSTFIGSRIQIPLEHLSNAFTRGAAFTAFLQHFNATRPFFLGFRPKDYPEDFHYAWRSGPTATPAPMGIRSLHRVSFGMRVYDA